MTENTKLVIDTFTNILASVILFVIGYLIRTVVERIRLQPLKKFWLKFLGKSNDVYLVHSSILSDDHRMREYNKLVMAIPDAIGMIQIFEMLKTKFGNLKIEIEPAIEFSKKKLANNIRPLAKVTGVP